MPASARFIPAPDERVPSTKMSSRPFCFNTSSDVRSAHRSGEPRSTGKQLQPARIQASTRVAKSSRLAMQNIVPGAKPPKMNGSILLRWLATTSIGPVRGNASSPSMRRRRPKNARNTVRLNSETMRYRQGRLPSLRTGNRSGNPRS